MLSIQMVESMKANGKMIKDTDRVMRNSPTGMYTRVSMALVSPMGKEFTHGRIKRSMTESGTTGSNTATASGEALKETPTSASGSTEKLVATVFTFGRTRTSMRASGTRI